MLDYLTYWKVPHSVFKVNNTKDDLFLTKSTTALLKRLHYFCESGERLMLISANAGMGKTSIAKYLPDLYSIDRYEVIEHQILEQPIAGLTLADKIAKLFGKPNPGNEDSIKTQILNQFPKILADLINEKRRLLLVVDDAHLLRFGNDGALIEHLLSFATSFPKSLSIILLGEPVWDDDKLCLTLRTQVGFDATLEPWTHEDLCAFIKQRLSRMKISENIFSTDAIEAIKVHGAGFPARITAMLEHCLMEAYVEETKLIQASIAERAAGYLTPIGITGENKEARSTSSLRNLLPTDV